MTKKLLIAAGDSWTDPNEECYRNLGMTEIWPDYVAKFLDMDLINVGLGGAGNEYIHNKAVDAIEQNADRDIVVMVGWSQSQRLVPYEMKCGQLTHTFMMPELEPPFGTFKIHAQNAIQELAIHHVNPPGKSKPLMSREEFWLQVGNISMRAIWLLNDYCERRNIPIIHGRALHTLGGIEWILRPEINHERRLEVIETCKQSVYYNKIMNMKNTLGDRDWFAKTSTWFDVYQKYWISLDEKHPNEKGMQLIAHSFVNKYLEIYEEATEEEPAYVYD